MVDKLWYTRWEGDNGYVDGATRSLVGDRKYIQEFIDLYCYDSFKVPEDITPDNLQFFIEKILIQFQYYNVFEYHLVNLAEALEFYFDYAYNDEFPDGFRTFNGDKKSEPFYLLFWMAWDTGRQCPLPEDVPFILECLNYVGPDTRSIENKFEAYFSQFDTMQRFNIESGKREKAIKRERIEALEKGEPLPIRPMSIELDPCYKK